MRIGAPSSAAALEEHAGVHKQRQIAHEIVQHLEAGRGLSLLQMATRSEWRQFVKTAAVAAGEPSRIEHFRVLGNGGATSKCGASKSKTPGMRSIGKHINSLFRSMGAEPELACRALTDEIRRCLDWHANTWKALAARLEHEGLRAR